MKSPKNQSLHRVSGICFITIWVGWVVGEAGQDEIILKLTPPWGLRVLFSILLKMLQMCIINGTEVFNSNDSLLCVGK